jgi:hypothetical protein
MTDRKPVPIEPPPPLGFWPRVLGFVLILGSSGLVSCQALFAL